ncbi:FtsK/SpoIIIE domain-containing protein [Demequina sp. NBRC 110054]|uniref:FtsK/SpoIIIE domain-containing protein n=1 Tax=Demequina sp. NBRC 110054 TaxID=1570343 RepID=UPI000A03451D|nr:FtsK/SpoIIIE domain-containing protein [Demequina sp. NBRC 110054]
MDLLLTLREGERARMVSVTLADGASVVDLARRLGRRPEGEGVTLRLLPLSRGSGAEWTMLDPACDVHAAGLRSGDEVCVVAAPSEGHAPAAAAVRAVSGPDAGTVFPLRRGVNVVGRDPGSAVRLTDPLVAGRHAAIHVGVGIEIHDLGSSLGLAVAGTAATRAPLGEGDEVSVGGTTLRLGAASGDDAEPREVGDVVIARPLPMPLVPSEPIDLPEPPSEPEPRGMPRAALLAPALMGMAMFAVTGRAISLVFVVMSPLMMIAGVLDARGERRRRLAAMREDFEAELGEAERLLAARVPEERKALEERSPPTVATCRAAAERGPMLWTRRPEHPRFLALRLGTGHVRAHAPPSARPGGRALADARERVAALAARFATVPDAPVIASLDVCGAVGIAGPRATDAARAVVLQVAILHAPSDCALAVLAGPEEAEDPWRWTRWLPHAKAGEGMLGCPAVAAGRARADLLEALERLVSARSGGSIGAVGPTPRTADREPRGGVPGTPSVVVIVDARDPSERSRLVRLAERGADVGVHVVWVADLTSLVPGACRIVLVTHDDGGGLVMDVLRGGSPTHVRVEAATDADAEATARLLAPLVDAAAVASAQEDLPREAPLVPLHGVDVLDPSVHAARWRATAPHGGRGSLRALIGHAGHAPFYLDLVREGPHALIGGTTGAGKSELLQAWILGMACAHGPREVTFLLVDYKGGAAFAECVGLPHTVGLVTDLEPRLADRVLLSLRAELSHRERLLSAAGAKDLDALHESGGPATPRLVVVLDEFATLAAEVPAFLDGVVDIAQRGRSLGLHLIMATQRPAGVIRDNLRANTNLRLALRVADESDSRDVLGVGAAAHLDPAIPGRVLVRSGAGPLRRFHSAFGGARSAEAMPGPEIGVADVGMGVRRDWPEPARDARPPTFDTDAARVVEALRTASALVGGCRVRRPWLDELPASLALEDLPRGGDALVLGLVDEPQHQRQAPLVWNLATEGALLIVGGPGAGASTALRTIAAASARAAGGRPTHLYGIDSGGGGLSPLHGLPQVGDVIEASDTERLRRLLGDLAGEVRRRRREPPEDAEGALPRVVLLIDGAAQLQAECLHVPGREQAWEDLRELVADGPAAGVHVAMTAERSGAVHTSLRSLTTRLLLLRAGDDAEYALAGLRARRLPPDAPPGRVLDAASGLEAQLGVPGGSPRLDAQAQALAELGRRSRSRARPVPRMPRVVAPASLPSDVDGLPVLGIDESTLAPTGLSLERSLVIAGPAGSGRTAALAWVGHAARAADADACLVHLSPRRSSLGALAAWTDSHAGLGAGEEFLARWGAALARPAEDDAPVTVLLEHLGDLGPGGPDPMLAQVLRQALRLGHVVVAEADSHSWTGPLATDLRSARRGIVLAPEPPDVQMLLGVRTPRMQADCPPGRAVAIEPGRQRVIQIPFLAHLFSTEARRAPGGSARGS